MISFCLTALIAGSAFALNRSAGSSLTLISSAPAPHSAMHVTAAPSIMPVALSGTYTIGGASPDYATIDAALADLAANGVIGPVIFEIRSGTYVPPATGYVLNTFTGMSTTNTVTFKPASGATVTIAGTTNAGTAVFLLEGAKYYIFDGSNTAGGTTKDMTIRQTQTTFNPAFWLRNDADNNVIKNCIVQGDADSSTKTSSANGIGIIFIGTTTAASGNDNNLVQNCTIGDTTGTFRSNIGVGVYGTSGKPNTDNKILNCDIVNFGGAGIGYGVVAYAEQDGTTVEGCDIHMTLPAQNATQFGIYTDYSPGYPINSVFTRNRIFQLSSTATNWMLYGMYHWVSTSIANTTITNNMISLTGDGDHTFFGIFFQSSTGTTNLWHNSFNISGNSTGARATQILHKSAANTVNSRNNIFYSTRTGGTAANYGLFISLTTGWNSDYNLISANTGSNFYTARYSGDRLTVADYQTASGQDANSVSGDPRFIDPVNGDLHISTSLATPVESRGTPLLAIDFDQQARNATTPDIGADEGTFIQSPQFAISATAGTPQSADINTAFSTSLQATVTEFGIAKSGISVTFTAPGVGASGTFSASSTVSTAANGVATAPTFTANGMVGGYNVTASVTGGSPSTTFALTNTPADTSTALSSSANPSNFGQSVTFTATVTSASGTPTGSVQFKDGGSNLGSAIPLNVGGVAQLTTSSLTSGTHTITADYLGHTNFDPSTGTLAGGQVVNLPALWTTTGGTGATEDEANPRKPTYTNFTAAANAGSPAGTYVLRYNINAVDNLAATGVSNTRLRVRYRDEGAGSRVVVKIMQANINGGNTQLGTLFDSDAFAPGGFQTQEILMPAISFDFVNNSYWLEVTLTKADTMNIPAFGSAQINQQ
jgi:hypothetical protein